MFTACIRRILTNNEINVSSVLTYSPLKITSQIRSVFILKRRYPPGLTKEGRRPQLRGRHFVYDLVEDTLVKKTQNIDVILSTYVAGLGDVGDRVSMKANDAYSKLLLLGKAVYATPENEAQFKHLESNKEKKTKFSSPTAQRTVEILSRFILSLVMNKDEPWELQPWHVRTSFRKAGFVVPEKAIEMPLQVIRGPDLSIENKEFLIHVTVNGRERTPVRCRIHHWSTVEEDRLPFVENFWSQPVEPLFAPDDAPGGHTSRE